MSDVRSSFEGLAVFEPHADSLVFTFAAWRDSEAGELAVDGEMDGEGKEAGLPAGFHFHDLRHR
jgi:hypothetical protein